MPGGADMPGADMLELEGVRITYGSEVVIDGLSWEVGSGDALLTALLGPSGCGKSTLIRAIAGLEPLAGGVIRFGGADLVGVPVHRRDFGVVFQDGQLFGGRTVSANIGYGLRMRHVPRKQIAQRVTEMLELVDLAGFGGRRVGELSGGQAQRVALARALAPRPRLLLLDEPLAALDRGLRDQLAHDIAAIVRDAGVPAVVVTHDRTEAAMMADEIAVMRAGEIVQSGEPERLWRRPVDEWTARFLGCSTVIDAHVRAGRAQTALGAVALDRPDGPYRLGLRAEAVAISPKAAAVSPKAVARGGAASGRVREVVSLPAGPRVRVATDIGEIDAVVDDPGAGDPSVGGHALPAVGDDVEVRLVPGRVAVIGQAPGSD